VDERGRRIVDDTILVILNADERGAEFRLPNHDGHPWQLVVDTATAQVPPRDPPAVHGGGTMLEVSGRSAVVLLQPRV
jgi:glycogen operon protein